MAGIYIHIPYCRKRCYYCDFHTSVNLKNKNSLVQSILKELDLRIDYLKGEEIKSIYFGGGTPSLLNREEIESILNKIKSNYSIDKNAEITLEANPDDLDEKKIKEIHSCGINRLSIGLQSFDDDKLKLMNRRHDSSQAVNSVLLSKKLGFDNISIDLIYGLPGLTLNDWKSTIEMALKLGIQHISSYHLTYEPKTIFYNYLKKGKIIPLSDEEGYDQFLILKEITKEAGFEHYEISNFALPGFRSNHNSNYWRQEKYIGIGPSAHSFDGNSRQWNINSNQKYIDSISNGRSYFESEVLDLRTRFNEYTMTSLRTIDGLDLDFVKDNFGLEYSQYLLKNIEGLVAGKYAVKRDNYIRLTDSGVFISDRIISDLFIVD